MSFRYSKGSSALSYISRQEIAKSASMKFEVLGTMRVLYNSKCVEARKITAEYIFSH